mgnify:CR=1 FL=1
MDSISDLLTRIRNGVKSKKREVNIPSSRLGIEVVKILKEEGYVKNFKVIDDNKQGILRVYLRYSRGDVPVIKGLRRMSSPGLRRYLDAGKVRSSTRYTQGIAIISTSSGVMTNFEAAEKGIGGEIMLRCW